MSKENTFGITREEILDLAAEKLTNSCLDENLSDYAHNEVAKRVEKLFGDKIIGRVDKFLDSEMAKIIAAKVQPVDIWGEKTGTPTTIKEVLADRAKKFWEVKVDEQGRESSYSGIARSERMMRDFMKDEFTKAIQANASTIVTAFKAALEQDAARKIKEFIDGLIRTK